MLYSFEKHLVLSSFCYDYQWPIDTTCWVVLYLCIIHLITVHWCRNNQTMFHYLLQITVNIALITGCYFICIRSLPRSPVYPVKRPSGIFKKWWTSIAMMFTSKEAGQPANILNMLLWNNQNSSLFKTSSLKKTAHSFLFFYFLNFTFKKPCAKTLSNIYLIHAKNIK